MTRSIKGKAFALFLSGTACVAAPAYAQPTEPAPAGQADAAAQPDLDAPPPGSEATAPAAENLGNQANEPSGEIIVTATRRAESLQDVPMSVDVATGQTLQRLNIFDVKDVQQLSPGLGLENTDGRSNFATLRGVSFDPDQGTDPAVDTYFNEVPTDAQNTFAAIYDIDQIEVLRGPQGALRGRTSPAGAITIRTRRANLNKGEGYFQATGSEDHAFNFQGALSVPLIDDMLAVRVAGLVDGNRMNQVRNVNRDGQHSWSRTNSARASLAFKPTSDINVNLTYQYLHFDNRFFTHVVGDGNTPIDGSPLRSGPSADVDDYIAVQEGISRFRNSDHRVTLNADWNMGPVTLSVVGGYQHATLRQVLDDDAANAIPGFVTAISRGLAEPARTVYPVRMFETRLASNNEDGFWNWGVSYYYYKQTGSHTEFAITEDFENNDDNLPDDFGGLPPGFAAEVFLPIFSRTHAVAANSRFQFTDKLRFEVAARYSDIKKRQQTFLFGFPFQDDKIRKHPVTGAANLTYEFNRDLTAYLAYGRAFRAPTCDVGVAINFAFGANFTDDLICTKEENSDSFEAGVKTSFLDRRMSFNAAAFYQKFDGFISRIRDLSVNFQNGAPQEDFEVNYNGDATVKGIEGTLSGRPLDQWDFSLSAAWVKGRYDNATLPCNQGPILPGNNVPYCTTNGRIAEIPNFNLSANTEYRFSEGPLQPFVRGLLAYRPGFESERQNYDFKSRTLLSLYAGVRGDEGRWELNAFVKNVLDQNRINRISAREVIINTTASPDPNGDLTEAFRSGYRRINATNPREFGLTGMIRF